MSCICVVCQERGEWEPACEHVGRDERVSGLNPGVCPLCTAKGVCPECLTTINSFSIRKAVLEVGGPVQLLAKREHPNCSCRFDLYQLGDGTEVINTNGEPVWDSDDGFRELRSWVTGEEEEFLTEE